MQEAETHEGSKGFYATFLENDRVLTIGFAKASNLYELQHAARERLERASLLVADSHSMLLCALLVDRQPNLDLGSTSRQSQHELRDAYLRAELDDSLSTLR